MINSDIICVTYKYFTRKTILFLFRKAGIIMGKFDEIFDDVVVNAKAAASAVSKKASDFYDASKHKITAAEIRGEINKKLRDLGALTYKEQVHGIDLSGQVQQTVAEITELKDNLNIINEHIAASKNQKKCPQCDANVPKNSVFCNICGARLDEVNDDDFSSAKASEAVESMEKEENTETAE